jgi:hypothetical protein
MHDAACDATVYSRCDTTIGIFIVTFVSESIHKIKVRLLRFLETRNSSRLRLLGFVLLQLQPMGAPQSGSPNGGSKMWRLKWAARRAALRCLCGPGGAAFEGSSRIWTGLVGLVSQGVGGPTVCSCFEPLPCAPSSRCGRGGSFELWAASSSASVGDPRSGGRLWSYAGRSGSAFGGGVARGSSATSANLRLRCEALRDGDDGLHGGAGSVGHRPLWTAT